MSLMSLLFLTFRKTLLIIFARRPLIFPSALGIHLYPQVRFLPQLNRHLCPKMQIVQRLSVSLMIIEVIILKRVFSLPFFICQVRATQVFCLKRTFPLPNGLSKFCGSIFLFWILILINFFLITLFLF